VKTDQGPGDEWPGGRPGGALADIGYTIPGQSWTYWHLGPGAGPDYLDEERGREWSHRAGRQMAANRQTPRHRHTFSRPDLRPAERSRRR